MTTRALESSPATLSGGRPKVKRSPFTGVQHRRTDPATSMLFGRGMLWRVRTTLEDRPGSLAELAHSCGVTGVNILALQIFPGVHAVTDELVLNAPDTWGMSDVAAMVESAGGRDVSVSVCTPHALVDGPTNYLLAVRHVVEDPSTLELALTELLDGAPAGAADSALLAVLEVPVGDARVRVRRAAAFTATEEARATAFASVVGDLLEARALRTPLPEEDAVPPSPSGGLHFRVAAAGDSLALVRMGQRCSTRTLQDRFGAPLVGLPPRLVRSLLAGGPALVAQVGQEIVGLATLALDGRAEVSLLVEDQWQGQGIGTRLLALAARLAKARGADELVMRGSGEQDVVGLSAASGLTGRLRHVDGTTVLTVSLRRVAPLLQDVGEPVRLPSPAPASA